MEYLCNIVLHIRSGMGLPVRIKIDVLSTLAYEHTSVGLPVKITFISSAWTLDALWRTFQVR